MNITIAPGGERLYVFPFLRHIYPTRNQFHYIWSDGYPYQNEWALVEPQTTGWFLKQWFTSRRERLRWFWYSGPGKLIWTLRYIFKFATRWGHGQAWMVTRSLWRDRHMVGTFLAVNFPDLKLHLPRQIMVNDPDGWTDTIYLTPNAKWVRAELELELSLAHRADERADYDRWLMSVKPLTDTGDYEVDYIVVLDT